MKRIILLLVATTFMSVSAQKKGMSKYKWMFSASMNNIDMRAPVKSIGTNFKDHIGFSDANVNSGWGIPIKLGLERTLNNAFSLELSWDMNSIKKTQFWHGNKNTMLEPGIKNMNAYGKVVYDLNSLIGETGFFDPYLNLGAGWSRFSGAYGVYTKSNGEAAGDVKLSAGYGANLWFTKTLALKLEASYNHAFNSRGTDYFQHSVGLAYRFGRSDRDKDGVADAEDACPDTPGLKEFNGCPDTDGDGIKDSDDACPKVSGLKEMNGCPDEDGDGVKDSEDKCPKEVGPKDNDGCPWADTDGDGITDNLDKCPKEAGAESEGGCPVAKLVEPSVSTPVDTSCDAKIDQINQIEIYFDTNKSTIKSSEKAKLQNAAAIIKGITCPNVAKLLYVSGYADVRGSDDLNAALSERRANAVKAYLKSLGVVDFTLEAKGLGETDTKSDLLFNRRVELRISK